MTGWGVLGLGSDPVPGDPPGALRIARQFHDDADLAARATSRLRSLVATDGELARS